MLLSNFRHSRQRRESDCLVACADMVLNHLGVQIDDQRLSKILRAQPSFTPFSNLRYLEALGLFVTIGQQGDLTTFEPNLELGLPVVVGVQTITWAHWQGEVTRHAVVVMGIDLANEIIYIHDPFLADAPIELPLLNFEIGWEEQDREYAVIRLAPP